MRNAGEPAGYPTLLSDIGGVVVENHWARVAHELARNYPIDPEPTQGIMVELCSRYDLGEESLEAFHQRLVARLGVPIPWVPFRDYTLGRGLKPIPETLELYRQLRGSLGVKVIALSNMSEEIWEALDHRYQISAAFDGSVLSSRCHVKKPDPLFFAKALAVAGRGASECLFVDDQTPNVQGARSAGIPALEVTGDPRELRSMLVPFFPGLANIANRPKGR